MQKEKKEEWRSLVLPLPRKKILLQLKIEAFSFPLLHRIQHRSRQFEYEESQIWKPRRIRGILGDNFFSYVFTCFLLGFFGAKYLFIYNNNWVFLSTCSWSENFSVFANPERQKWAFGRKSSILYIYKRKRKVYKLFNFLCF